MDKSKICAALGIDPNSSDDAVMAALTSRLAKAMPGSDGDADDKKMAAELGAKLTAAQDAVKLSNAKLETVKVEADKLVARVQSLEKDKADGAVAQLCSKLMSEGRMKADDKAQVAKLVEALGIDEATKLTASWPKQVPLTEIGRGGAPASDQVVAETPAEAYSKFTKLAEEHAATNKVTVHAAKFALMRKPELQTLIALASRNGDNEKRN